MSSRRLLLFFVKATVLLLTLNGCRFYVDKKEPLLLPQAGRVGYALVRERVFAPSCIACHGQSGGLNLENYTNTAAALSRIEKVALISKVMPPNKPLSSGQSELLKMWIEAGAPESIPDEPMHPPIQLTASYQSIRQGIIEPKCMACHSSGGPAAKVPFEKYSDFLNSPREIVVPGNSDESGIVIAVERDDVKRMPPAETGASKLSDHEIKIMREWIQNGAKED